LAIGEKLFERKGKTTGVTIKSVGPDGVTTERNIAAEIRGFGRAEGVSGRAIATTTAVGQQPRPFRVSGYALITTKDGETVVVKSSAFSKREGGRFKVASISTYMRTSAVLSWLNDLITLDEIEADITVQEFTSTSYEWK
jgi:hypothetical protein